MKKIEKPYRFCLFLFIGVLILAVLSLCIGAAQIAPQEVLHILLFGEKASVSGRIVLYTRLPRLVGSVIAGAGLAVTGAVIQTVLSNPLASPHVIGVNNGAGFAVTLCLAFASASWRWTAPAAFIGALTAVFLVLFLTEAAKASKTSLILAGVAIESIFAAATEAVLQFAPNALSGYSDFRVGDFSNLNVSRMIPALLLIPLAILILLLLAEHLDVMMLGADTAKSLGLPVKKMRILFLTIAAMISGLVVSYAGMIGFVGLLVPHIMRNLLGENSRVLLLSSALGGALLLTLCDLLARTLFLPFEIPVGILTSLLGGPFFIFLVFRRKRRKYD